MVATTRKRSLVASLVVVGLLVFAAALLSAVGTSDEGTGAEVGQGGAPGNGNVAPQFRVDPDWPKPLPNNWVLGQVGGMDVAQDDTIWIVQRPRSLDENAELIHSDPAPPVMQFDRDGNLLQAWGPVEGPEGVPEDAPYEWFDNEHGLWVDHNNNVWLAGNGGDDHQVLKFTRDGEFLLQIGEKGETGGNNDTELLGRPADGDVDPDANEVYIADGYLNNRVIVFDADTGEYKRHWGAYGQEEIPEIPAGEAPFDDEEADQFGNPVHCSVLAHDGLVYVCDRANNRVQVFETDGTFVSEFAMQPGDPGLGSTWDVDFSPDRDETFLFIADGSNQHIYTLLRADEELLDQFGRGGRYAGQFQWVHNLATDSKRNLYTAEVETGKRAQKFEFRGYRSVD